MVGNSNERPMDGPNEKPFLINGILSVVGYFESKAKLDELTGTEFYPSFGDRAIVKYSIDKINIVQIFEYDFYTQGWMFQYQEGSDWFEKNTIHKRLEVSRIIGTYESVEQCEGDMDGLLEDPNPGDIMYVKDPEDESIAEYRLYLNLEMEFEWAERFDANTDALTQKLSIEDEILIEMGLDLEKEEGVNKIFIDGIGDSNGHETLLDAMRDLAKLVNSYGSEITTVSNRTTSNTVDSINLASDIKMIQKKVTDFMTAKEATYAVAYQKQQEKIEYLEKCMLKLVKKLGDDSEMYKELSKNIKQDTGDDTEITANVLDIPQK